MRNTVKIILISMPFFASMVYADLLDCIDPDVTEHLMHNTSSSPGAVTRKIPADIPEFRHPSGSTFVASSVKGSSTRLVFVTDIPRAAAENEMASTLETSGFERQADNIFAPQGFQIRVNQRVMSLCSDDDQQTIYIASRRSFDKTYVIVTVIKPGSGQLGCRELQGLMTHGPSLFMPALAMPPDTTQSQPLVAGGGNDSATTGVRFKTRYTTSKIVSFFSQQLSDQQWKHEGDWVNNVGEGSAWSAQRDSVQLSGYLQVVPHNSGSGYSATFTIDQFEWGK